MRLCVGQTEDRKGRKMNNAQKIYAAICGMPDYPKADLRLAMEQTKSEADARRMFRGTPPRKHHPRLGRKKLFKGHRA